jgi:D-sedoheptulose 7-phosphate isomerase/D-glycero-D-manno-heptose 1,7-bisphosphate phosphatase
MSTIYDVPGELVPVDDRPAKFPRTPYGSAASYVDAYAEEFAEAWREVDAAELDRAAEILLDAYTRRVGVYSCGNGGSASIANHLQCDHVKNVRTKTDLIPRVVSLSNNMELLTAISNDMGYESVFAYQLESQSVPGDVLIAISSSGRSANIVRALTWARENNLRTIALTGFDGGAAKTIADVAIHFPRSNYGIIEDLHQAVMHALAQYISQSRMTPDAIAATTF